jgi:hypothetical protein
MWTLSFGMFLLSSCWRCCENSFTKLLFDCKFEYLFEQQLLINQMKIKIIIGIYTYYHLKYNSHVLWSRSSLSSGKNRYQHTDIAGLFLNNIRSQSAVDDDKWLSYLSAPIFFVYSAFLYTYNAYRCMHTAYVHTVC